MLWATSADARGPSPIRSARSPRGRSHNQGSGRLGRRPAVTQLSRGIRRQDFALVAWSCTAAAWGLRAETSQLRLHPPPETLLRQLLTSTGWMWSPSARPRPPPGMDAGLCLRAALPFGGACRVVPAPQCGRSAVDRVSVRRGAMVRRSPLDAGASRAGPSGTRQYRRLRDRPGQWWLPGAS